MFLFFFVLIFRSLYAFVAAYIPRTHAKNGAKLVKILHIRKFLPQILIF